MSNFANQKLWSEIKMKWHASDKAGDPGQWTARKAQLAVKEYKNRGGKYTKKKTENPSNLEIWTAEKWGYVSNKGCENKHLKGRYLPENVRNKLTQKQRCATNRKKIENNSSAKVDWSDEITKLVWENRQKIIRDLKAKNANKNRDKNRKK